MADNMRSRRLHKELTMVQGEFIEFVKIADGDIGKWQVGPHFKKKKK